MDQETLEKLKERVRALEGQLQKMAPENAAALQLRACATHLTEAADRLDVGDITYGFVVAETMSYELGYKAMGLKAHTMSVPLEGQSLTEVVNGAQDAANHRFVELLEKACGDNK